MLKPKINNIQQPTNCHSKMTSIDDTELYSDESSFYGDETQISHYEDLATNYDPEPYWSEIHPHLLATIQHENLISSLPALTKGTATAAANRKDTDIPSTSQSLPRNTRGSDEPISEFLSRLPPSKTTGDAIGPWIFVNSPHNHRTNLDEENDEGKAAFIRKATTLLHEFEDKQSSLEAEHDRSGARTKAGLTRKLNPLRRALEGDIFGLARESGVVSGKWMLFPTADSVDKYWAKVAEATAHGELGFRAKVATDAGGGNGRARGVMVYTRDYEDIKDVRRLLQKLVELGLVRDEQKPIYYKVDAYTYLEILGDNPYGLKASLFSSKDVLAGKV